VKRILIAAAAGLLIPLAAVAQTESGSAAAQRCESLVQLRLPSAKVTATRLVAAGEYMAPPKAEGAGGNASLYGTLPAFCFVGIIATPTRDSDINVDVWLPTSGWNGRFRAVGNGGFAGYINYHGMALAVRDGFATASTDTGHRGGSTDAAWALNHPEKVADFGYRAIHEMTLAAKATIHAFYGEAPRSSYFGSCSNGGRQALMEVQRYPKDYDGVIAGAPANYWTHLLSEALWGEQAMTATPGSYIPPSKIPAIAAAVNAACDRIDGVRDSILNDPRECHFNPQTVLCKGADSNSCLTAPQTAMLKKLYEGAHDSHGHLVFPGLLPGAEGGDNGWRLWITGPQLGKSLVFAFGTGYFANMVYDKADWSYKTANFDDAVRAADAKTAGALNATDPNLRPFQARGGKLIIYHGWDDPAISPLNTVNYYDAVLRTLGEKDVNSFVRLYMVPGMQHCGGGPGPDSFGATGAERHTDPQHNLQLTMRDWVEKGIAPGTIIATKYDNGRVKMTRPLCPYPREAKYKGSGDTNDAANFTCAAGNN
jgi:hypothetical protein